jgi:hypothetical protein
MKKKNIMKPFNELNIYTKIKDYYGELSAQRQKVSKIFTRFTQHMKCLLNRGPLIRCQAKETLNYSQIFHRFS